MASLRVWAPNANRVDFVVDDRRVAANPAGDGWWQGPEVGDGARYAISLDDGPPRPDPRSRWQPEGVHGASRWLDPEPLGSATVDGFAPVPLRDAVIYELHLGTFTE